MDTKSFQSELQEKTNEIEVTIEKFLPKEEGFQKIILEAMNYSVKVGGKRLRPLFMSETYKMFGGKGKLIEAFMAAIEMIHTYSLVHDDLPAMDNDEYRRGKETTWKVYGDAMGVLAGDGLLNLAYETVAKALVDCSAEELPGAVKAFSILSEKAGVYGMVGGQTVDVWAEKKEEKINFEQLLFIHEYKTAALIQASMMVGAALAGASDEELLSVEKCAYDIGIAFQIQDDILDVVGTMEELGKPIGSDERNNKQTYVTLVGLEKAKEDVKKLSEEAITILDTFKGEHGFLKELVVSLIYRTK